MSWCNGGSGGERVMEHGDEKRRRRCPEGAAGAPSPAGRIDLPPYETDRADAAGRRRARRVSGGRLSGARRSGHPSRTGSPAFRSARSTRRSSRAMRPKTACRACSNSGRRSASPRSGRRLPAFVEHALFNSTDDDAQGVHGDAGVRRARRRAEGLFRAAFSAAVAARVSGPPQAASYYDTAPLKATLEALCDFDRINSGEMRVSVGAVNVATGNFAYFDNTRIKLRARAFHGVGRVAAGLRRRRNRRRIFLGRRPDVEYAALRSRAWPRRVATRSRSRSICGARAGRCRTASSMCMGRVKDIQYSSRTRIVTDMMQRSQRYRNVLREVLDHVPRGASRRRSMVQARRRTGVLEALQRDPPDLPAQGIRGALQGLISSGFRRCASTGRAACRTFAGRSRTGTGSTCRTANRGFVTHDIHRDGR